jgi:hypothetical protein
MTLNEITQFACDKVGVNDDDSIALCKRMVENRYRVIWDKYLWRETIDLHTPDYLEAGQQDVILHEAPQIERVLQVCKNDTDALSPIEWNALWLTNPEAFNSSGSGIQRGFTLRRNSASKLLPDDLDTTIQVGNDGTANTITLTGLASIASGVYVPSSYSVDIEGEGNTTIARIFRELWSFTRLSTGTLDSCAITTVAGGLSVAVLDDRFTKAPVFPAFRLWEPLTASDEIRVLGKLRCPGFTGLHHTGDEIPTTMEMIDGTAMIQGIDEALIAFAQGDMLQRQRQYGKAQILHQEGAGHVANLIQRQVDQAASGIRIIPQVESSIFQSHIGPAKSHF